MKRIREGERERERERGKEKKKKQKKVSRREANCFGFVGCFPGEIFLKCLSESRPSLALSLDRLPSVFKEGLV